MTKLLQRLHDELVRRNYATTTRESYLRIVRAFHRHAGGRLDRVSVGQDLHPRFTAREAAPTRTFCDRVATRTRVSS